MHQDHYREYTNYKQNTLLFYFYHFHKFLQSFCVKKLGEVAQVKDKQFSPEIELRYQYDVN